MKLVFWSMIGWSIAFGQNLNCDLHEYKPADGLKAESADGGLRVSWQGERAEQLRAIFAIRRGQPLVQELAVRKGNGWVVLGSNLIPQFDLVSGRRRISEQQMAPLRLLKIA